MQIFPFKLVRILNPALVAALCALAAGCASTETGPGQGRRPAADPEIDARAQALAHYATGVTLELNDDLGGALEQFTQAAKTDPTQERLVLDAARRFLEQKQPDKALELLEAAARAPQASPEIHAWLGFVYAQTDQKPKAIAANRTAIRKGADFLMPYQTLVQVTLAEGNTREALRWANRAAKEASTNPIYWLQLADLYLSIAQKEPNLAGRVNPRVVAALKQVEALGGESPGILQRLGDQYRSVGELSKAEGIYLDLLKKAPNPLLRERLADVYLRMGRKEEAVKQIEAIKREFPTNPNVYFILGNLAEEERRFDAAAQYFEDAIRLNPDFEQAYYELAGVRISMDQAPAALQVLEKARQRFKGGFIVDFYTGLAHMRAKAYSDAVQAFGAAEAAAQKDEPARLNQFFFFQAGAAHERAGLRERAVDYFRKSIDLAPDFAEALNYLGYMWAEKGENLVEARKLIEKAVRIEPENAAFLDSLGWVLFKQGHTRDALKWLLRAIQHSEEADATLHDHLGDIYSELRDWRRAVEAWQKSLSIEANDEVKRKLREAENKSPR